MRKLFSSALSALLVISQSGFAKAAAAEFSAPSTETRPAAVLPFNINETADAFSSFPIAQPDAWLGAMPVASTVLGAPQTAQMAEIARVALSETPVLSSEPTEKSAKNSLRIPSQIPTAANPSRKVSVAAEISRAKILFKNPSRNDIINEQERLDQFWNGSAFSTRVDPPSEARTLKNFENQYSKLKAPSMTRHLSSFAYAATPAFFIPAHVITAAGRFAPDLKIGGIILAAYLGNRLAKRVIDRIGNKKSWTRDRISLYKSGSFVAIWGLGAVLSLPIIGVSLNQIVAGAGITGVFVSIAAGDVINNFFEAGRVLLARPFESGDHIKIGSQEYAVRDIGLHDLKLVDADGSETIMPYTILTQSTISIVQESSSAERLLPIRARLKIMGGILDSLKKDLPQTKNKSILKAAAVYLAAGAVTYLRFSSPFSWLTPTLAPIQAALLIATAITTAKIAQPLMKRIGDRFMWSKQQALIFKSLLKAAIWILGGGLTLKALGTSWGALVAGLGFISLGVGLVSQNIFSGFWRWFLIRFGYIFGFNCSLKIGDAVSTAGIRGIISDIGFSYIVLTQADGVKSYVHYSIAFPFTKLPMEQTTNAGK